MRLKVFGLQKAIHYSPAYCFQQDGGDAIQAADWLMACLDDYQAKQPSQPAQSTQQTHHTHLLAPEN